MTGPVFLPWLRVGLAAHIDTVAVDGLAPHDTATATVGVLLHATGADGAERRADVPSPPVRLRGPGDVVGIAAAEVVRCEPSAGTFDAEPNYFAHIEFASPDLPWRYTPAAPDGRGRLQPWLVLVVVQDRPGVQLQDRGPLARPVLHIDSAGAELPDPSQCWAWAHVQSDVAVQPGDVAAALRDHPEAFRSRLMCPRRLASDTPWIACVVPVFEAGRRAALGEAVGVDMGPAWAPGDSDVRLPVYYSWRFSTGPSGDFESLVRKLKPRELPATVGRRDLDVSEPGAPLPPSPGLRLTYAGALLVPGGTDLPWPQRHHERTVAAFGELFDAQRGRSHPAREDAQYWALRDDPVVGAPAYASAQAHRRRLPAASGWFTTLNTEPPHRVVAALGAAVVRHDQEAMMAAAWEHAVEHRAANRVLGRARLGWEVSRVALSKVEVLSDAELVQLMGPALARLRAPAGGTLRAVMAGSAMPQGLVSGAMRRRCRTVAGLSPVVTVTATALADAVAFSAVWRRVHPPTGADLQATPGSSATGSATGGRADAGSPGIMSPARLTARLRAVGQATVVVSGPQADLAGQVRAVLDPAAAIAGMVETLIPGLPQTHPVPVRVWARPRFTNPMYTRLRAMSAEVLVPGASGIPPNTVGLLETNPGFVEAFLAGLNYELGREFRWREYPARLDDTWSRHFWDTGPGGPADITPISQWETGTGLGSHRPQGTPGADLVLLIKGALPRRYPDLRVYAVEATWNKNGKRREKAGGVVCLPVLSGRLGPEVHFYGFALSPQVARGSTDPDKRPGYFLVLEQRPGSAQFGLDQPKAHFRGVAPGSWADLSWAHLVTAEEPLPGFVSTAGPAWLADAGELPGNGGQDRWADDAAAMARITWQRPVRMLMHASAMLPEGTL